MADFVDEIRLGGEAEVEEEEGEEKRQLRVFPLERFFGRRRRTRADSIRMAIKTECGEKETECEATETVCEETETMCVGGIVAFLSKKRRPESDKTSRSKECRSHKCL